MCRLQPLFFNLKEKVMQKMGRCIDAWSDFVKLANETGAAKDLVTGWNPIIQYICDGEENFYIKIEGGKFSLTKGVHKSPSVTFKGPEEVFFKFVTREINPTQAYFAKQYTIEGSLADAMKFGRVGDAIGKAAGR
jgi:putative sterol carrier protein